MNQQIRIAVPASSAATFTTAEFLEMAEGGAFDDKRMELVDGELHRMNPPMGSHSFRQTGVLVALLPIVGRRALVEVVIDLGNDTVFACDVAVLHAPVAEHRLLAPQEIALVVEIAETTLARDLGLKRARYAAAGIPEYWVVDGARAVTHVFREPVDGEYAMIATVRFGEPLAVPGTRGTIMIA